MYVLNVGKQNFIKQTLLDINGQTGSGTVIEWF
jgi:hypothetical protein